MFTLLRDVHADMIRYQFIIWLSWHPVKPNFKESGVVYCHQILYTERVGIVSFMAYKTIELCRPYHLTERGTLRVLRKMFSDRFIGKVVQGYVYYKREISIL